MSKTPMKYRKKPVEIEARQFLGGGAGKEGGPTEHSTSETHAIYKWIERNTLERIYVPEVAGRPGLRPVSGVGIDPCGGQMTLIDGDRNLKWVNLGDWIIRDEAGAFYVVEPDIFAATYEEAPVSSVQEVRAGQVWRDRDKRSGGRTVEIVSVGDTHAEVVTSLGRKGRIRLDRFRPTSTGYELSKEAPNE